MTYKVRLQLGDLPYLLKTLADKDALSQQLMAIADSTRAFWAKQAQRTLGTTRQAYLLGLSQPVLDGTNVTIELNGDLANMIEQGRDPFSLAEGFLNKPQAKIGKDGTRYRAVALRMTAPFTKGRAGQPMDQVYAPPGPNSRSTKQGQPDAEETGIRVYAMAKALRKGKSLGRLLDMPKLKSLHTLDPFSGLTRSGAKGHRYYVTFRTVSDRHPEKWQHPGFAARNFAEAALKHAQRIGPKALMKLANALRKEPEPEPGPEI